MGKGINRKSLSGFWSKKQLGVLLSISTPLDVRLSSLSWDCSPDMQFCKISPPVQSFPLKALRGEFKKGWEKGVLFKNTI